jgi:hypothetical protein
MTPRLPAALALLLLLAGGLWWVAARAPHGDAGTWEGPVYVIGPGGLLANGTVASQATPLAAVEALGNARGFRVEVEQQPWIGRGCTAAYVRGIGGVAETSNGGWNYYVRSSGGDWTWRPEGAACYVLSSGQQVEWCWVESDVCKGHVA